MIKTKHHFIIYPLFRWLTCYLLKRNFTSISINGNFIDNGKALLVISNHISWWDGFWVEYINQKMIHRKMYFMMLEDQLKKHWYFQYTGGYSIKKKSKDIIESIDYTIQLLKDPQNIVLMFPQGEIKSVYNNIIHFENGINRIIKDCSPDLQVLFVACFPEYLSDPKPNVFIYLKNYSIENLRKSNIESEYNLFFNEALNMQKSKSI